MAVFNWAMYKEAHHVHDTEIDWVDRYVRESGVTITELRSVDDPLGGYLRKNKAKDEQAYYQAAMYAQAIERWQPMRLGIEMRSRWVLQCLVLPLAGILGWRWLNARRPNSLPPLNP